MCEPDPKFIEVTDAFDNQRVLINIDQIIAVQNMAGLNEGCLRTKLLINYYIEEPNSIIIKESYDSIKTCLLNMIKEV